MASRHTRSGRWLVALGVAAVFILGLSLLAGVVTAARRDAGYRRSVDNSFAAAASAIVESSNVTGAELATVLQDPGALGRALLESRLEALDSDARHADAAALRLSPPPPDANADVRIIDTMRLRADAVTAIRATLEGLLGLTPTNPTGAAAPPPPPAPVVHVPGAEAELRYAGEQLLVADRAYRGLPYLFYLASAGGRLPQSRWTSPQTGRLMPETLLNDASTIANDPRLAATVSLAIVAVQTQPLLLPVGPGYPVPPTTTFAAAVSVVNGGTAPSRVIAIIRARPLGRLGAFHSGTARGVVAAGGAVALQLPVMQVVPGEHCLVTIDLVRPLRQSSDAGLTWSRTVVVAPVAPAPPTG